MDTAISEQSLRLLEEVQRAIPALLASGDFVGNLETSLRILGETLALDFIFVSVTQAKAAERREEPPHLHTVLVLENERGRWSELLSSNAGAEPFQYKEAIAADLQEEAFFCGKISDFLNANNLNWEVEENDKLMFIPLRAGHHLKGVLAVGKKQGEALNINFRSLKTYTATLANWLERYEVFRQVRGERDHLRDVLNMGISSDYDKDVLKPEWEHSIMDAQLLNRKIVTTIPDQVFIIDLQDHSNLYSNKPTFLGYRLDDIDDPFEFFQQLIHPDDVGPAFENFFEKLSQSADDEIIESEYRMYSKEGELTWFNERVKVFKRDKQGNVWQYLNILQDITKRKKALEANERSQRRYKNFITYSTDGIYFMNCGVPIDTSLPEEEQVRLYYQHAHIEDANPAIARMYNLDSEEDLIGKTVEEVHAGVHYEKNQNSFRNFIRNNYRVELIETIEKTADGKERYFQNSAVGTIVNGKLIGIWGTQQDITAKREAENARKESDALFRNLFEKNPLGVVIGDPEGNLLRCNQRFAEMLGYRVEELERMNFMQITCQEEIADEWAKVDRAVAKRLPTMVMEKRYLHRDGLVVWANVSMSISYHKDGRMRHIIAMIEDITEKRKIRLRLEENEAFQKAILSTLPDLKFRLSKEGVYIGYYPSPNDDQDLLVPPEFFLGKNLRDVLPDYLAGAVSSNIRRTLETRELQSFEYMLPVKGNMFHFEMRLNAIDDEEVIAVIRNVSERNWAQVELKQKIKELDEKNRQLKDYIDSNMQLENFAYIASHDLREPLRTMATFAQLLEKKYAEKLDETARTYIDFVVQGSRNLNNLIEDLLVYSRIQTQENRQELIELPELLLEVINSLKDTIEENGAQIRFANLPDRVNANPNRLTQLFQNLLANAIKFRKPEVPVVVQINSRDLGNLWEFEVKDNGIGIDPEFHEKVFLLFKKLHSRKDFQGTGLGLAICKKVVEQMGGEIWIESAPNEGSSFFFTMPK